ncbi:MAG TPA: DEAD/DEAH box helicase [Microbacteriaceae bacterium]|nr:DEAD/DEAH box helicase [Microbacteriaceae bacterium]
MTGEPSPAQRYAAARSRTRHPDVARFEERLPFDLDPYQRRACTAVSEDRSVLVAAPTGAGKTVVAEFAVFLAMQTARQKVFYTTPMKALSNQKYQDLCAGYGADRVGLLTGDSSVNPGARVVVMTTEVLRNMLYASSPLLDGLAWVVLDEVHYLGDRFRGAVWEEVIIQLPAEVRTVSLSATVSNAEEFGAWLQAVRGDTAVIVSERRPVPLTHHVAVGSRLTGLFEGGSATGVVRRVNPELLRLVRARGLRAVPGRRSGGYRGAGARRAAHTGYATMVRLLGDEGLLPSIVFIFSRAGCDRAVEQLVRAEVTLTSEAERREIRESVEARCRTLLDEDLGALGYWDWLKALQRGIAAHHAGLLPAFKETVEDLFRRKLVKVVFATETLALGINMPARSVVLDSLEKFNGESTVPVTPGEYTQLTGRAGRRGIDDEGHSVIRWRPGLDAQAVASLASRRSYPLNSSFRPTYNMAVNLVERFGRERTREVLESSFAQFQADRTVRELEETIRQHETALEGYAEAMRCDLGDFTEYAALRRSLSDVERRGRGTAASSAPDRARIVELRQELRRHPCDRCPDRETHARWAARWWRLERQTAGLREQVARRSGRIATLFDRVSDVLVDCGYLASVADAQAGSGRTLVATVHGRMLGRIYGERDLLVAECLRRNVWRELDAAALAAVAAALTYEPRHAQAEPDPPPLRGSLGRALEKTRQVWERLDDVERAHLLPGTPPIPMGLCPAMRDWARGVALRQVLRQAGLAAGDFVRAAKQAIDLLGQVRLVAPGPVARTASAAIDALAHGVVAYSSVPW